jgi:hypothetical protein
MSLYLRSRSLLIRQHNSMRTTRRNHTDQGALIGPLTQSFKPVGESTSIPKSNRRPIPASAFRDLEIFAIDTAHTPDFPPHAQLVSRLSNCAGPLTRHAAGFRSAGRFAINSSGQFLIKILRAHESLE